MPMQMPSNGAPADMDRTKLARFVGVWNFSGWSLDAGGSGQKSTATGRGAATIEHEHFVLLYLDVSAGKLGGRSTRKGGSMLFASEPGLGVTLTAWGDASPSVNRLIGGVDNAGSVFQFDEAATPAGMHRISVTAAFETDDFWVATIRDLSMDGNPVVARYEFTRVKN